MRNTVSDILFEALKKANLTQSELATKTGYKRPLINRILSGDRTMTITNAFRIQDHLPEFNAREDINALVDHVEKTRKI